MKDFLEMNPNPLVQYLNKPADQFTKADLITYIADHDIEMVNFRYLGGDSRLKTLNFVINSMRHLDEVLSAGERVDGSSLFPFIQAGASDLYVIPKFKTAFVNPFSSVPTLDILCDYYDRDGQPMESAPEHVLRKAHNSFKKATAMTFEAMGELEYYLIGYDNKLFHADDQKGYHESTPFSKWADFRREAMRLIAQSGGQIKYGHSEVGNFHQDGFVYEQNEIEFLPVTVEDAADQLVIAKWILRTLAYQNSVAVTFAPKITVGKAGSGMHIHTRILKDGINQMIQGKKITHTAKKAIAGYLEMAPSLTAFGNTNPTSYFRLVPHQEAPTNICWGDRNRSVLVRVPLGWTIPSNMIHQVNPQEAGGEVDFSDRQTIEFRCPDGSADVHFLMAGLTVAARHGFEMKNALEIADQTYVDVNIFDDENKERLNQLKQLPDSCWQSAELLQQQQEVYLKDGVFTNNVIEGTIKKLKAFDDKNIRQQISNKPSEVMNLVEKFFNCG